MLATKEITITMPKPSHTMPEAKFNSTPSALAEKVNANTLRTDDFTPLDQGFEELDIAGCRDGQ